MDVMDLLEEFDASAPLERAWGIPSRWYLEPEMLHLERERVFAQAWQYVGPAEAVAEPGQYLSAEICGEPIIVVRGNDGVLRGLSNVCRHRGGPLVREPMGRVQNLRCLYHGWTYGLTGELKGTPDFEGVCEFDKRDVRLPHVKVAVVGPFVFAHLGVPEAPSWPGFLENLAPLSLESLRFAARRTYEVECNWKVYIDNYLDGGYHIPYVHPALFSAVDYGAYRTELYDGWNVQISPMRKSPDPAVAATRQGDCAYYYWLFPNFTVNWYEGTMDVNHVVPLSPTRTRVIFDFWFAGADLERIQQSIGVADQVQEEDRRICEDVQQRLSSRWYNRGRFSVRRENGGHQFHVLLAQALQI